MGDFNEISNINDKLGGAPMTYTRFSTMNYILNQLPCIELPFDGPQFTWRKKKAGPGNKYERLNRAIVSSSWISLFPQAKLNHNIFTSSDHCQITLNNLPNSNNKAHLLDLKKCGV